MFVPFKIKAGAAAVALALASGSFTAHAVLERAGPVTGNSAVGFFPSWYQDRTGITLEFCSPTEAELDGTWCLLGTAEVPVPPEVFPANFFDEHFYFAAGAGMDTRSGGRALLVLAEEAAFASGSAQAGQQIVFSRIRVRLASAPVTGNYRFIHPYGEETIFANAGERIFFTEDIGIDCAPGKFDCSTTSRLGPFLLPSAVPGGTEMRALTAEYPTPDINPAHFGGTFTPTPHPGNGKAYIADPSRIGPVTGSPVGTFADSTGAVRDHNIFRIEGPVGSGLGTNPATGAVVDWIETTGFSLMGRLFNEQIPGRVAVQRASYARNATDGIKVDVMADGQPTTASRMPSQAQAPKIAPALSFFNAPCVITTDTFGVTHYSPPSGAGVVQTQLLSIGNQYWGQTRPASIPASVCVYQSNAKDLAGNTIPVYAPQQVTDEVTISQANYDQIAKTLTVQATSSDAVNPPTLTLSYPTLANTALVGGALTVALVEVPPHKVKVTSNANNFAGGSNEMDVRTPLDVAPPPPPPAANNDSFTMLEDAATQALNIWSNDSNCALSTALPCTVTILTQPLHAQAALVPTTTQTGNGPTVSYRPVANYNGPDSFTYRITKNGVNSAPATVSISVTPVNDAPTAAANTYTAAVSSQTLTVPATGVLANDVDVDGDALTATLVTGPVDGTLNLAANGSFTYSLPTPPALPTTRTFTYRATDSGGLSSATATVTMNFSAPLAAIPNAFTFTNTTARPSQSFAVLANDTSNTSPAFQLNSIQVSRTGNAGTGVDSLNATGSRGAVSTPANGTITYRAPNNSNATTRFTGTDSFFYRVRNNNGTFSNFTRVDVTIN